MPLPLVGGLAGVVASSEVVTLSVPLGDANGLQDLARVTVDLDLERSDALVVEWTAEAGCNETHPFLTVLDCRMEGAPAALTPFSDQGYLRIDLRLDWGFDPSTTARTPSVSVEDRGGQFSTDRLDGCAGALQVKCSWTVHPSWLNSTG